MIKKLSNNSFIFQRVKFQILNSYTAVASIPLVNSTKTYFTIQFNESKKLLPKDNLVCLDFRRNYASKKSNSKSKYINKLLSLLLLTSNLCVDFD